MSDFKRRKEKYQKFFEDTTEYHALDVRCQHLLLVFFIIFERTKEIGFGALFRELGKWSELKMSRSMLSDHLKHLEKKGIIKSRQLKESRRRIADKRYRLTPLIVGSAEGFLRIENDQFRANLIAEASKGVDDHALVATVFRIFATYGLEALHYTISLDDAHDSTYARRTVYSSFDTFLRCLRKAILQSNRKEEILKEVEEWLEIFESEKWPLDEKKPKKTS